jgi:hypothetical protein
VVVYVLCVALFILLGFAIFLIVSDFSRDVLRIHEIMARGIYSDIQSILVIVIYVGSFLLPIPVTRHLIRFLSLRISQKTSNPS